MTVLVRVQKTVFVPPHTFERGVWVFTMPQTDSPLAAGIALARRLCVLNPDVEVEVSQDGKRKRHAEESIKTCF